MKSGGRAFAFAVFLSVLFAGAAFAQNVSLSVVRASAETDTRTAQPVLSIEISEDSSRAMAQLTRDNVGRAVELRVDGEVLSKPVIREPITGTKLQISGNGTAADFQRLAKRLNAGGRIEAVIVPQ